jgi:hypothetical protein
MSIPYSIEVASQKFHEFLSGDVPSNLKGINEATTRLLIVDSILEILGWSKTEFNAEKVNSIGGYTDYRLTIDGQSRLIVEAKKMGRVEQLPRPIQSQQYKNIFLYNSCGSEMQLLLRQCQEYCIACGVPYAVATTGEIWIVLVGFKYGVEWGTLRSFVFHSLEDIYQRFSDFYGLISREAVLKNSLEEKFGSMVLIRPTTAIRPREHLQQVADIAAINERHIIDAFFDRYLGEITRTSQEDMLEHCYVSNRKLDEFSQDLQQLLTYDVSLDEQDILIDSVDEENLKRTLDFQFDTDHPRTILLVGNVGAGKSTFVHRFIRSTRNDHRATSRHVCVVTDLIDQVQIFVEPGRGEEQKLADTVLEKLAESFQDKLDPYEPAVLRGCFEIEVGRFKRQMRSLAERDLQQYAIEEDRHILELSKDKYKHLIGYLKYARKKKYKPWIVLDNVDRGSDSYQEFVYAFAHRLSADTGCVTFITLREDTFLEAQEAGFLDVRSSDIIFRIPAPEFRQVVSRRRKYVDRLIANNALPKPFKSHLRLIDTLNWHLSRLVLSDDDFVRYIITTFSLGNIRYGLSMLRRYYTSCHCTFHELFRDLPVGGVNPDTSELETRKEHNRFMQALMLGNSWSYREDASDLFNIFSVDPLEHTSHFLMLRVLSYLNLGRNTQASRISVSYEKIRDDFVFLGYQKHHVNNAVRRLLYAGLLISPNLPANPAKEAKVEVPDPITRDMKIALSAKGLSYLKKIAALPYYQLRVGEDMVWYDEEMAKNYIKCLRETNAAQKELSSDDLLQATDAREIFLQYLKKSLLEETQTGNFRYTVKDWARIMNDTVERCIFGESLTQAVYSAEQDNPEMVEPTSFSQPAVMAPSLLKQSLQSVAGKAQEVEQKSLFASSDIDHKQSIQEAVESLGSLPTDIKVQGSAYVVRVLWALEIAFRAGIGPLIPTRIAEMICNYGNVQVEPTNVAKFIRLQNRVGDYSHLWRESPKGHYSISSVGRDKLHSLLQSERQQQEPIDPS